MEPPLEAERTADTLRVALPLTLGDEDGEEDGVEDTESVGEDVPLWEGLGEGSELTDAVSVPKKEGVEDVVTEGLFDAEADELGEDECPPEAVLLGVGERDALTVCDEHAEALADDEMEVDAVPEALTLVEELDEADADAVIVSLPLGLAVALFEADDEGGGVVEGVRDADALALTEAVRRGEPEAEMLPLSEGEPEPEKDADTLLKEEAEAEVEGDTDTLWVPVGLAVEDAPGVADSTLLIEAEEEGDTVTLALALLELEARDEADALTLWEPEGDELCELVGHTVADMDTLALVDPLGEREGVGLL